MNQTNAQLPSAAPQTLKILCIGNSFSCDTIEHVADIARSIGVGAVTLGNLYIGGCSVRQHYANAVSGEPAYEYFVNTGGGWTSTQHHALAGVIEREAWDWIVIQHGTTDGSRYAEEESYRDLPALIAYIKAHAAAGTKVAFNMTWVGEADSHPEMLAFGNDQKRYYQAVADLTRRLVLPTPGLDRVSPTGTAIQNARAAGLSPLTRDGYHLSFGLGRCIAGLTLFKALTGTELSALPWAPADVPPDTVRAAVEAAENAVRTPFSVTDERL